MGCTEPIALAYCAATARSVLGAVPDRITVEASGNIIKNVKSVVVPHTGGRRGIAAAAAIGVLGGDETAEFDAMMAKLSAPLADAESARRAWHAVLAYNGVEGFRAELAKIGDTLRDDPPRGAAMLRNRVCCMQHRTQWTDGMTRIADGTIADAPAEYLETVREFMTREVPK